MVAVAEHTREQLQKRVEEVIKKLTEPALIPKTDIKLCPPRRWERGTRLAAANPDDPRYETGLRMIEEELDKLQEEFNQAHAAWLATFGDDEPVPYLSQKCLCDGCRMYDAMTGIDDLIEATFVRTDFVHVYESGEADKYIRAIYDTMKEYQDCAKKFGVPVNMSAAVYGGWG